MKKFLSFLIVTMLSVTAYSLPKIKDVEYMLNQGVKGDKVLLGYQLVSNKVQTIKCLYDFSVQGGAISTVTLKAADGASCVIPDNAVVLDSHVDVVTALAGSGAYVSISTGKAAADVKALTAIASITGILRGTPDGAAANAIKMTAEVNPSIVITSGALTAGKFSVYYHYVMGD
jgi:hypothetical protein